MEIYLQPKEKMQIFGERIVRLGAIADIYAPTEMQRKMEKLIVFSIPKEEKQTYLLSILDLVRQVKKEFPDASIINLGETNVLIEYSAQKKKENKLILYCKIIFICVVLAVGASTAIMSFHSDAQLPRIFSNYCTIFFGEDEVSSKLLSIPYSLGLGFGIIVFFNHFSKKYLTDDPTPIEVQMTTYDKETMASTVDTLVKKKQKEREGDEGQ